MNTGPADTRSPHLDLEDLIAEVTGQAITDQARAHLAGCEHCRAEASRWALVAGGVRGLAAAADAPPSAQPTQSQLTQPRPSRLRVLAGPRRRMVLAASAAAALVILGGAGYGVTSALTRHASGTVLTAVTGCTGVELANGTLEKVNGTSLVIRSASGKAVTVTTAASTKVSVAGVLRADITDGASVIVLGPRSGGTIAAANVTVTDAASLSQLTLTPPSGWVAASGTVADASTAGFTVVTSGGTRVPVTTTGGTFVVMRDASLGQLQAGAASGAVTTAVGRPGPGGTLSALGVVQQPAKSQFQVHFSVKVNGCPPATLAAALDAVRVSGG